MQRGQWRAQVVGDIGDHFAAFLVLMGDGAPLFAQAVFHLHEGVIEHGNFIAAGEFRRVGFSHFGCTIDVELADFIGQLAQRSGDPGERNQPGQQAEQGDQADGPQRDLQCHAGGILGVIHVMSLTEQHDIEEAGLLAASHEWCGAEHLAAIEAARVITEDRQHESGQEAPHGREVDSIAQQMTTGRGVTDHTAIDVEQVNLDTRVDQHQLAEQVAHRVGLEAIGVHQLRVAGNVRRQVAGQALHHLQFMHAVGAHLQPGRGAAANQQQ